MEIPISRTVEDDRANKPYISLIGTGSDRTEKVPYGIGVVISRLALKRIKILKSLQIFKTAQAKMAARKNRAVVPVYSHNRILADLNARLHRKGRLAIDWIDEAAHGSDAGSDEDEAEGLALDASDDETDLTLGVVSLRFLNSQP